MSRRISRLSFRCVFTISTLCSFVFITALAAPRLAHAHNGVIHTPEVPPEPTPDVVVSASPGGDYQVFLPVVIVGSFVEPVQPLPTPEPESSEQKSHEQNDYDLAEAARQRNDPPFEIPTDKIKAAEAPGDLINTGTWSAKTDWPFVLASAAYLPDGRIVGWGGNNPTSFSGGTSTYAAVWDPNTNQVTSKNNNDHSMFCAIPTMLEDGRVFVSGGDGTRERTSIFDFRNDTWTRAQDMSTGRWYAGSVYLPNGKVFTAIGDPGGRYPEVWTSGSGWSLLTGADLQAPLLNQAGYQSNWLPYFHVAPNGLIFHSGPVTNTNWINPTGSGSISPGQYSNTWYPKYSAAIMYDEGKILVAGGMQGANTQAATNQAQIINLNSGTAQKTLITGMNNPRTFPSGVVLPTGEVMVIGGNVSGVEFVDTGSILPAEIWNPDSQVWRTVASISVPRNYHSVALLMTDGRVWSGGGGLCACNSDHPDHQIFTPGYLYAADGSLATRPAIDSAPNVAGIGQSISVQASAGVQRFTMIRMAAVTHNLNSDTRFLNVPFTGNGTTYQINLHSNANVLIPGYWMLFALNNQGVPSLAKVIQITTQGVVNVANPGPQSTQTGQSASLQIQASSSVAGALTYSASGLPSGFSLASGSGLISGAPTTMGVYTVTVSVANVQSQSSSQTFIWTVTAAPGLNLSTLNTPPKPVNTAINYVANFSGGTNPRFKWFWGDGSAETSYSSSPNASHSYAAPGLYTLKLTATDDAGLEKTQTVVQAVHLPSTANRPTGSMNILYEARATGNHRVWVVNQDNDSVSVFDAVTNAKLAEINVGSMPRNIALAPNGNIWVTNKGVASISIISPSSLAVAQTVSLPNASQPFGVVFAPTGGSAFVALEASGTLLKLDASNGSQTGNLAVGPNVRGLAVTADGASVLVSRFVTPKLPGEETANVQPSATAGGEVVVVNAGAMSIARTVVLQHSDKADAEAQGSGIPNYVGAVAISPDGLSAWVPSKQDNIKRGTLRNGNGLNFQNSVRAILSRIDLSAGNSTDDLAGRVDHDNSSVGSAAVFDRYGSYIFTALETSREVGVVDAYSKKEITRFGVGRAPQGLALSADGMKLYVNNFMDRSVQVFDLSALMNRGEKSFALLATVNPVTLEKLTAQVLNGKRLFYDAKDPRLARDSYLSCASCHNDGGQDGRVWDFTGFGEGLRNTVALRGRSGAQGFLHWSGNFNEVQDFEGQIRNFAGGTGLMSDAQFNTGTRNTPLGDAKAGVSTDLDALAAYLASLNSFAPSPFRNSDGSLTTDANAGRSVFASANCAQCHGGTAFSSSGNATLFNIGTLKTSSGQRLGATLNGIDPPTLRDVWASAPYLHDGSAATLNAAVSAHNTVALNAAQVQQVVAYLQQIGGQETSAPVQSQNLALGKAATQSSTYLNSTASRAVDGNTEGNFDLGSTTYTNDEANAWWQVDLGASYAISNVVLWNRTDCCANRLTNFYVFVSAADLTGRTYNSILADSNVGRFQVAGQAPTTLNLPVATSGRFVRVQLAGSNSLSLAELQVFGGEGAPNAPPSVSLSTPANNATFNAPAIVNLAANASDSNGTISGVEFFNGGTKLGEDSTAPYSFSWTNVAAGAYAITAKATDNAGATTTSAAVNITVNAAPTCTLPSGIATQDIGNPGVTGSACESNGTWTLKGGGADIWNSADQFRFAYQSASAATNATIVVRVNSVQNTDYWAKAGAMFRDGTAANARFAMVTQMPNNEVAFFWRSYTGGSASWNGSRLGGTANVKWVRLVKRGTSYTAYYSTASGVPSSGQWVQMGSSRTVSMNTPKAGLAVTAHNNGSLNTTVFTSVSVTSP